MTNGEMQAADFAAFLAYCREEFGWDEREVATQIGVSKNMPSKFKREGAKRCVALACAAVAAGLGPWRREINGRD